jgi:crossover junction endonuclease MUS81
MAADEDCANPLLLEWVKEWMDTARERNSKGFTVYRKAYDSLKACPIQFQHPSEAQQLHGFGPKLCERLTEKLKAHCQSNGLPMPEPPRRPRKGSEKEVDNEGADGAPAKKKRKPKPYVPQFRSGAYAIVLALATLGEDASTGITKQQTIELAQPFCDASFSAPSDPTKFHTAWSSMKTLIEKDLVYEKGRPLRRYQLTDEGFECAKRLKASIDPQQSSLDAGLSPSKTRPAATATSHFSQLDGEGFMDIDSQQTETAFGFDGAADFDVVIPQGQGITDESSLPTFSPITVPPSAFEVELVLDTREIRAKEDRDYMRVELSKKGVKPIMRSLDAGDALWVAKFHDPAYLPSLGLEGDELMLDYIVERKRLDDLVSSIKDGRFHEQKFRLKKSGVKNVIYIIEEISMNADHFQKYEEAVESAITSSQVVNGYFIKKTSKMDETIRYLTRMTVMLKSMYKEKPLFVIPTKILTTQNYLPLLESLRINRPNDKFYITYPAFGSLASKSETLTLRDVYLKMLMCTRGVTGEKALEIQRRWETPRAFLEAFEACGAGDTAKKRKMELVSGQMGSLVGRRKIAKATSVKIAEVWSDIL